MTEKLTNTNHLLWKAQVLPTIRVAHLMGFLDGSNPVPPEFLNEKDDKGKGIAKPNLDFEVWIALDQQVLGYLFASLSPGRFSKV